jgi:dihydroflavonol-4-reductase
MRALVTGSTGFVGANLVQGLVEAGHQVRALQRRTSRLDALAGLTYEPASGDILDPASLAEATAGMDWVFHVAAVADYWRYGGAAWLYHVNVGGTRNVLETALAAGVQRVILTSSAASLGVPRCDPQHPGQARYAERNGRALLDETATFNLSPARLPYGHSKHLAEKVARGFVQRGLEVVILLPTAILGPRDVNMISGSLILAVYRRQVFAIPPGGVNYIDVGDVVAGHIAAAERGQSGQRYILGAHNLTHEQAATTIAQVVGVAPPRLHVPEIFLGPLAAGFDLFNRIWPGDPLADGNQIRLAKYNLFYDASKSRRELRLGTSTPFAASVERTFRWYRDNGYI